MGTVDWMPKDLASNPDKLGGLSFISEFPVHSDLSRDFVWNYTLFKISTFLSFLFHSLEDFSWEHFLSKSLALTSCLSVWDLFSPISYFCCTYLPCPDLFNLWWIVVKKIMKTSSQKLKLLEKIIPYLDSTLMRIREESVGKLYSRKKRCRTLTRKWKFI